MERIFLNSGLAINMVLFLILNGSGILYFYKEEILHNTRRSNL